MDKIIVLMGGTSNEREVSLLSGKNVADALESLGKYEVARADLKEDNLNGVDLHGATKAYIALHGGWGENGGVQGVLNEFRIPYTGPGKKASEIAMDKIATKKILDAAGIPNARWAVNEKKNPFGYPVVVKVPRDGSSVGVFLAHNDEEYKAAIEKCWEIDGKEALIEEYIPGREMTVGVIGETALPVVEIVAKGGWYGYEEKYNSNETKYPFLEDGPLSRELQDLAVKTFKAVGCRGVTRIDFRVSPEGKPYVLELNTSPGFTGHSLVPKAGMKTGLTFAEVCDKILNTADYDK